ncbi:MAG: DNA polymerase III subunit gamma/tau [Clostridia bacterium]|nr:DNA polymerase III subunit gamma/tau [Clostridia bacterium]
MAYQALYRKYRPLSFSDVVGQDHITKTLKNSVRDNKTVHAYIFTGTRGTGKTTCAKILARAVNCLNPKDGDPCGECEICRAAADGTLTDIVEIDAASNNGVDNVRELREQVNFPPVSAKYRVYIIDEVHMLSQGAFNALLKTLEEPPEHVIFILATTEIHKLPATILSRCQRFDFKRIDDTDIVSRLFYVAKCEGLSITEESARLIAGIADGALRDALSILDLCAAANTDITEDVVFDVCSMASNDYLIRLAYAIKEKDTETGLSLIDELHGKSVDMHRLIDELTRHFRDIMIVKTIKNGRLPIVCSSTHLSELKKQAEVFSLSEVVTIIDLLRECSKSSQGENGRISAEMTIMRLCNPELRNDIASLEMRISALESLIKEGNFKVSSKKDTKEITKVTKEAKEEKKPQDTVEDIKAEVSKTEETEKPTKEPKPEETLPNTDKTDGADTKLDEWEDIVAVLETTCPIMAGVLKGSDAYLSGEYLLIDTDNSQFRSLYGGKNPVYRESIRKAAQKILGKSYKLGPYKKEVKDTSDPLKAFAEKLKNFEK